MTVRLKTVRIALTMICLLCILVSSGYADTRSQQAFRRNVLGRIESGGFPVMGELQYIPDDCSGYELQYRADLPGLDVCASLIFSAAGGEIPEPENTDGTVRIPLDEMITRTILENADLASMGPDESILSVLRVDQPVLFIWRGKTLVLLGQSPSRGAPDTYGSLKNTLHDMLNTAPSSLDNEIRWSPDGRYLFFNDSDRWLGARMAMDDPFLVDTQTGEIFLLENGGYPKTMMKDAFRCILNGRFSMDGKSFFWYCRSYVPGKAAVHSMMRYDLESGTQETICELGGTLMDFIEVEENSWLLLESGCDGVTLVRMTVSADGIVRVPDPLTIPWSSCRFLPVVDGSVILAANPLPEFGGTYLMPLTWDTPVSSSVWYRITSIYGKKVEQISADEIIEETEKADKNRRSGLYDERYTGTALVDQASVFSGTEYLLMTVNLREASRYGWADRYNRFTGYVLLNTEDMRLFPLLFTSSSEGEGLENQIVYNTNCFLVQGIPVGLFSAETMPLVPFARGETYPTQFGIYRCKSENDPLTFTSVALEDREYSAEIASGEKEYRVILRFTDYPLPESSRREYIVPEVLTEARWLEIKSVLSKKDQQKLSSLYMKIVPEKLDQQENRDMLLTAYPSAAIETLYILKSDPKSSRLESAEELLASAGYTPEDYARDMETAAVPRGTNVIVRKSAESASYPVTFRFPAEEGMPLPDNYRILQLTGLCDVIICDMTSNRTSETPVAAEEVVLSEYNMGGKVFRVSLENAEEDGNTLELVLTVIP